LVRSSGAVLGLGFQEILQVGIIGFELPPDLGQLEEASCFAFQDQADLCAALDGPTGKENLLKQLKSS